MRAHARDGVDTTTILLCWSERCSLHAVALLDPIWIDKWHQLFRAHWKVGPAPVFWASRPLETAEWLALLILKAGDVESYPGPKNRKLPPSALTTQTTTLNSKTHSHATTSHHNKKLLTLLQLTINSITNKHEELKLLVTELPSWRSIASDEDVSESFGVSAAQSWTRKCDHTGGMQQQPLGQVFFLCGPGAYDRDPANVSFRMTGYPYEHQVAMRNGLRQEFPNSVWIGRSPQGCFQAILESLEWVSNVSGARGQL